MEDVQRIYKRVSVIHVMRYDNVAPQAVSCSCAIASQRRAVSWEVRLLHCLVELIASNVSIPVADSVDMHRVPRTNQFLEIYRDAFPPHISSS